MNIVKNGAKGIVGIPVDDKLYTSRNIFLTGKIDDGTALEFTKQVMVLNDESKSKPINVFVCSDGGELRAGFLIYDMIQSSQAPIRLFCLGHAYSMAAIIMASGNHGRYLLPNSEMMIHLPLITEVSGNTNTILKVSDSLVSRTKKIIQILAKHTGKSEEEISETIQNDKYMNAEEAVQFGLADSIESLSVLED